MLSDERLARELLGTLDRTDFGHLGVRHQGKVRDSYVDGDVRTIVTTDRLSAFDRFLGTVPFKGQVLNEIANYWFGATSDIVSNHLRSTRPEDFPPEGRSARLPVFPRRSAGRPSPRAAHSLR